MSQFIKFYFTSSMLNMFQTLIYPSSGACDFSIVSPHWLCVLISTCVGVSVCLVGVVSVWQGEASACTPKHAKIKNEVISKGFCKSISMTTVTHSLFDIKEPFLARHIHWTEATGLTTDKSRFNF